MILRKVNFDEIGPLVYKNRYKTFKALYHNPGYNQQQDGWLIQRAAQRVLKNNYLYGQEWVDYIEDFNGVKKDNGEYYLQRVAFDHVLFYKDTVIIFESDDPSHYNQEYCASNGWNFQDIKRRDQIKNDWAKETNTLLVRLPEEYVHPVTNELTAYTQKEKYAQIVKVLKDVKNSIGLR